MPAVLRRLGGGTYGADAADGPSVRGMCARTAACRCGLGAPRSGEACWDARSSGGARFGPGAASGGVGAEAGAGGTRCSGQKHFTGADFEMKLL
jgi:hypothetical protein